MSDELELRVAATWDGKPIAAAEQVVVKITSAPRAWRLRVDAPFHGDPPPPGEPGSTPGLWDYEVVELFVVGREEGEGTGPRYLELELSPHGHYLLLRLRGIRRAVESLPLASYAARIEGGRWRGEAVLRRSLLPPEPHRVNAFAIHGTGAARRYLAMTPVPGPAPDFHRLEAFEPIELPWSQRGAAWRCEIVTEPELSEPAGPEKKRLPRGRA